VIGFTLARMNVTAATPGRNLGVGLTFANDDGLVCGSANPRNQEK
jgi:hypothetical protein